MSRRVRIAQLPRKQPEEAPIFQPGKAEWIILVDSRPAAELGREPRDAAWPPMRRASLCGRSDAWRNFAGIDSPETSVRLATVLRS